MFRIHLWLADNTWSTRCYIPRNGRHSDTPSQWTKLSVNFTVEKFGIELFYDQLNTPHADTSLSNITITHTVY